MTTTRSNATPNTAPAKTPTDSGWFRQVLGQYPTGVCIVTAIDEDGDPAGMVVGSFTSVSLAPPLVAFLPDRNSFSWARLRTSDRFCVNILGADQEAVCRRFASKEHARIKFQDLATRVSPLGSLVIDGAIAWIDCVRHSVHEAGDHDIVIGEVMHLEIAAGGLPLLHFQGGYGRFRPQSLAVHDPLGALTDQLRDVELARPVMEELADQLSARCIATVRVGDEIVIAAGAGCSTRGSVPTLVGQRLPFMPPTGAVFAAWYDDTARADWLRATAAAPRVPEFEQALARVRERGCSIGLISDAQRAFALKVERIAHQRANVKDVDMRDLIQALRYDPPTLDDAVCESVRLISVPVFARDSEVALALTLYDFPRPSGSEPVRQLIDRLRQAAALITTH